MLNVFLGTLGMLSWIQVPVAEDFCIGIEFFELLANKFNTTY